MRQNFPQELIFALGLAELAHEEYGYAATDNPRVLAELGKLEFSSFIHPLFFLLIHSLSQQVVGYINIDRDMKRKAHPEVLSPYWDMLMHIYPGIESLYEREGSLTAASVAGFIVRAEHRAENTALNLLTHVLHSIAHDMHVLIGLTKNRSAIGVRRKAVTAYNEQNGENPLQLWASIHQLVGISGDEGEHQRLRQRVLTLARAFGMFELGAVTVDSDPGVTIVPPMIHEDLSVQPYLPTGFQKDLKDLDPEAQKWMEPLYRLQRDYVDGSVAVLPLVAASMRLLQAMGVDSPMEPKVETGGRGYRYQQVLHGVSPKRDR